VLLDRTQANDRRAAQLLDGLRVLGKSLRNEGQIQPILIYAFTDATMPAVRYRIWVGQRRWCAALIEGLPTLDAIVVELPDELSRLQRQFTENEQRADFNDMERAWAIAQIRDAMGAEAGTQVPWEPIEQRLGISESLRKQQMRLLRFDREGQELLAYQGWTERTVRPIHSAIQAGVLSQGEGTALLRQLAYEPEANVAAVETLLAARIPPEVVFHGVPELQTAPHGSDERDDTRASHADAPIPIEDEATGQHESPGREDSSSEPDAASSDLITAGY
jgi:ParB/RepB/Spo0J family partition protein